MLEEPGGESAGDVPEWHAPPRMIGGHVAGPAVIGRTDGLVVLARQVLAYPAGIEIEVEAHARGASSPPGGPAAGPDGFTEPAQPTFRLRLGDGRVVVQDDEAGLRDGRGPVMVVSGYQAARGGPEDGEDVRLTLWTWPLPPPGPLALSCAWPERGLRDATWILDGAAVREAALLARPFWTAGA
ncbi:hypothetical protein ABT024_23695 [Streptomyces sp. NPDC002812]|uniref:hypothetical protein n=1 Tax=unclassified Streptomyces TaxID=2593676 RepID=UPI00202DC323|nr:MULTISPECIES: hypothetical protein [unclassified Streptomyces]MCM1972203.1 hypothetical protein [Streptomyces sp. G1]MCX5300600.1 hypothetical protein [Streptomyces sp. NBC_00193]